MVAQILLMILRRFAIGPYLPRTPSLERRTGAHIRLSHHDIVRQTIESDRTFACFRLQSNVEIQYSLIV